MLPEKLKEIRIEDYTYELPEEKIARYPLADRASSRLLLYEEGIIREIHFGSCTDIVQPGQLLVFNNTKVIYARLFFQKETGASIEVFCLEPFSPSDYVQALSAKDSCEWKCLVGNLKKWKTGRVSLPFDYAGNREYLYAEKISQPEEDGEIRIRFTWNSEITFSEILEIVGEIPIPPYLNRKSEEEDKDRYQTVYSREEGSVAAPTAGLHFTPELLEQLNRNGVGMNYITLHVGAGTFRPVKTEKIGDHPMHTEYISVSRNLISDLLKVEKDIIAVGTTSVRTLESLYWMGVKLLEHKLDFFTVKQWEAYELPDHYPLRESLKALENWFINSGNEVLKGETTIIILPGYKFRVVDRFFTNFHQPQSTLLLLVAAAVGENWKKIYRYAEDNGFRFLSYGDSSLLKVTK